MSVVEQLQMETAVAQGGLQTCGIRTINMPSKLFIEGEVNGDVSTTFTGTEVNNCFSIYHTS